MGPINSGWWAWVIFQIKPFIFLFLAQYIDRCFYICSLVMAVVLLCHKAKVTFFLFIGGCLRKHCVIADATNSASPTLFLTMPIHHHLPLFCSTNVEEISIIKEKKENMLIFLLSLFSTSLIIQLTRLTSF